MLLINTFIHFHQLKTSRAVKNVNQKSTFIYIVSKNCIEKLIVNALILVCNNLYYDKGSLALRSMF